MIGSDGARGEHASRAESPYLVEIHVNIIILISRIQGKRKRNRAKERKGGDALSMCILHPATVHGISSVQHGNLTVSGYRDEANVTV